MLMRHLGWPTRTGCHRGPKQRGAAISRTRWHAELDRPDQEVTPDPPGPPAAWRSQTEPHLMSWRTLRPEGPEQSRVPVTAALTLIPGPVRSHPGRHGPAVGGRFREVLAAEAVGGPAPS